MFESLEPDSKISKVDFEEQLPQLRVDLINLQFELVHGDFTVMIVIAGDDRQGATNVVNRLHEWMDSRFIATHVYGKPSDEELERPRFWRYWKSVPPKGKIGLFGGAWSLNAIAERLDGELSKKDFSRRLQHIRQFEGDLVADGALLIKFWIHLPHKEMKRRMKAAKKDPKQIWWVDDTDWAIYEHHEEVMPTIKQLLEKTSTEQANWQIIDGTDERSRDLTVAKKIATAIRARLNGNGPVNGSPPSVPSVAADPIPDILSKVDLSRTIDKDEYRADLAKYQRKVHLLMRRAWRQKKTVVMAFEGWDAAGKGGAIRRITGALPAMSFQVVPIAAPTQEELAHHYLWRFWRLLPRAGRMMIFDRSWYGRVLVERIEGFATDAEWRRAYQEIRDFEEQMIEHGIPVLKFWLHISPDVQLERFKAREQTPYKKYKITDEDYRNRDKWDAYFAAVNEMVHETSTKRAPWHLIPANDKRYARISILKRVCRSLEELFD